MLVVPFALGALMARQLRHYLFIILDHLARKIARIPQLYTTLHTPCGVFYLVPRLVGC